MDFFRSVSVICFLLNGVSPAFADETPLPLGAADLAPDGRFERFKDTTAVMDLEMAFEIEASKQLDLDYEPDAPSELDWLKKENEQLKQRVAELEHRLAAVEAKLAK